MPTCATAGAQATHAKTLPKKVRMRACRHAQGLGTEQLVLENNQLIYKESRGGVRIGSSNSALAQHTQRRELPLTSHTEQTRTRRQRDQ